ncbi:SMI1/KNR4 family protein [Actinoplanes sp. URMC 104]|uniref:SMI1/KNR4 family protein n=1 Tax=Actinoplanes sp. URMC 104 TaxID=3423409 RepID=UPI003F19A5AC
MSADVDELQRLVPPPPRGDRPSPDWAEVSARLGTEVPADYVELVETYGGGQFDDYLYLLTPFAANDSYDMVREAWVRAEAFELLWSGSEPRPPFLDTPGQRLLPWASGENGEFCYWLVTPGVEPDRWPVVVNAGRGPEWEHFELGCAAFLLAVLRRRVDSEILMDEDFPADPHSFRPLASSG